MNTSNPKHKKNFTIWSFKESSQVCQVGKNDIIVNRSEYYFWVIMCALYTLNSIFGFILDCLK